MCTLGIALLICGQLYASPKETYKNLIAKAQQLTLQKERLQAVRILARAAAKEKGRAHAELLSTIDTLAEVFYTEKGQQIYELAESLKESAPPTAIEKLQEALQMEGQNTKVLKSLIRLNIQTQKCQQAEELTDRAYETNPFDKELRLLKIQAGVCNKSVTTEEAKALAEESKNRKMRIFFDKARAHIFLLNGQPEVALQIIKKIEKIDPRFPELYFVKMRAEESLEQSWFTTGTKYVELCRGLTKEHKRSYSLEPTLCSELGSVEKDLEDLRGKN